MSINIQLQFTTKAQLLAGLCAFVLMGISPNTSAQNESNEEENDESDVLEVITVIGVRSSIERSIDDKRNSSVIKDSISAEDFGQLPDENIAEALQRVTGVQMARSADGEGDTVQIRGLNNNNVELNGQTISGSSSDRQINFQDLPSELFSGIEVLKTPTADRIEGSLGGTVNLKTRRPLSGKKEFIASVTGKVKYAEIADKYDPDLNAFILKQWNDTGAGDVGIIVNVGSRTVSTVAEAYGGGDFDDAPAIWVRRNGADTARNPFLASGPWQYDANVDVNGDGQSDENDVFYVPNGFGFFENTRTSERDSFNGSIQWQPNDDVNLFMDLTATDIQEALTGSRYSLNFNTVRSAPLASGNNVYDLLGETAGLGPVYRMSSGRMGAITTRMGASPSNNDIERESLQLTFGGDWKATDRLNLSAEVSLSEGSANTLDQGAVVMGMNWNCDQALNANDFAGIVDFNLSGSNIPDATLYQSPFNAPCWGVNGVQSELVAVDPSDVTYERLSYFQFNRVANDTENTADSIRLDGEFELGHDTFNGLKFGARLAERTFERASYQNGNQRGNWPSTLNPNGDPTERINIQRIFANPSSNSDADIAAAAAFLQECQRLGGDPGLLSGEGGNMPRRWTATTGCTADQISAAFNLLDIRAINPATGAGYYERTGLRYDVQEETSAVYLMTDFMTEVGGMELYGNVGGRYVETDTKSTGWVRGVDGSFSFVTFEGGYSDFLPSLNLNLAVNNEMIVRLGLSRSLGRPGLGNISPGLNLFRNDQVEGFDGNGTAGNPDLEPVHSDNIDLSFEWYFGSASLFSLAYFNKNIDSTIFLGNDQLPLQVGDENFLVRTFGNFAGTEIDGWEFGLQSSFERLPGLLSNTGIQLNYTVTNEDSELVDQEGDPIPRRRLSDSSYNVVGYYDDGRLNVRLAYNWREQFVRRENVNLGFGSPNFLPEFEGDRGQLDLAVNYSLNEHLKLNFSAVNINDSKTERYMKHKELTNYIAFAGIRYNLGFVYRF